MTDENIKPIRTVASKNKYFGVDGILITGTCPKCGQPWLNNRDNNFCGKCGMKLEWKKGTEYLK